MWRSDPLAGMLFQRMRRLLSLGLLACATAALGCSPRARIDSPATSEDPRVPDATAERLRACVEDYGGYLRGGRYRFDYKVKVDEEGRVVDVESKGVPHANLAGCTRSALRDMTVPAWMLRVRPAKPTAQAPGERGLVGNPGLLVVVGIALAELVIEAGPIVIVCAASLEISGEIAKVARKKKEPSCREHLSNCLMTDLADEPGNNWSTRRCPTCYLQCDDKKRPNNWPKSVDLPDGLGSCEYWVPKWKR